MTQVNFMRNHWHNKLPSWARPRAPLVAISLRMGGMWDYRFARFAEQTSNLFIHFWFLPIIFFPATLLLLILAEQPLLLFLWYLILILLAPVVAITSEIIYARLWLAMPYRTSSMIAGEVERRTWDIFRTIPYPRHQIVLGKVAALGWLGKTSLVYITLTRLIFFGGLIAVRAVESDHPLADIAVGWGIWWMVLVLMPLLETYAIACLGLFISAVSNSSRQASLIGMTSQLLYRLLSVGLFFSLLPSFQTIWVVPGLLVPQWIFSPFWVEEIYSTQFVVSLVLAFIGLPILVGSVALWGTIRVVDSD